jgi:hypothetical protein
MYKMTPERAVLAPMSHMTIEMLILFVLEYKTALLLNTPEPGRPETDRQSAHRDWGQQRKLLECDIPIILLKMRQLTENHPRLAFSVGISSTIAKGSDRAWVRRAWSRASRPGRHPPLAWPSPDAGSLRSGCCSMYAISSYYGESKSEGLETNRLLGAGDIVLECR